jgi:hypothetical protein
MSAMHQVAGLASDGQALERLKAFLDRFERWKQGQMLACEPLGRFLRRFRAELPELRKTEQEWEAVGAPRFNLFRVLRIQRKEEELHSRFLAELLNPAGSHGQGDLFLDLFFEVGKDCGLSRPTKWPVQVQGARKGWQVTTEEWVRVHIDDERYRLDIVLRCPGFITVIENKVDAREQEDQLKHYRSWLDEQLAEVRGLVFLTPDGRPPDSIHSDECVCLSYHDHIEHWLGRALQEVTAPPLRPAIEQYLKTVESL